ncbi:MAG TPA: CHAT domain-containing protein [Azonexus sp.]|nr:CHAT domain-containing protein [Azonexus sp.]
MPKSADAPQTFKIRGVIAQATRKAGPGPQPEFSLFPGSARDATGDIRDVPADHVVRVELENGFVLWSRVDDLARDFGHLPTRDGNGAWEFSRLIPRRATASERGLAGFAVKVLDFFGIDLAGKTAAKLGTTLEEKQLGHADGLYRLDLAAPFALAPVAKSAVIPGNAGPILIFLHGTASSTQSSFGELWRGSEGEKLRQKLAPIYGDRAFALEHRTLTQSPIDNALALARRLPDEAEIHLVSHSRGGLVGEVLCLAGCTDLDKVLDTERVTTLFAADRTLAGQLGLLPLSDADMKARDAAYDADRQRLLELVGVLGKKKLHITRFARVACPARGTTLASGRLDRWLSVLDYVAKTASGNGLFGDSVEFLHAVVKERTDPRVLPGVEAMMPGSALTRLLNNTPELSTSADLSVIAGDIEPGDGIWNTLKVLASDWFYKNDHDLVVDTASMSGGLPRGANARYRGDKGPRVNHFRYFINDKSIGWLQAALTRADGDNAGFQPIAAPRPTAPRIVDIVQRSRGDTQPRPIAVVLPGTMGSELTVGDEAVWLNYWSLLKGGLKKLARDRDKTEIRPVGLVDDFYGPLVDFLARSHRVEIFPYDWRFSVRDAAQRLAERIEPLVAQAERSKQPLRLVAHSMGGLVVRAMIADSGAGSALWKRIKQLPGSRFLMLGTPNLGSYEAVRWLTGFNPTQAKLSLLDITQSTDQIINLVAGFPGLLELLPFAPDDPDFTDPTRWSDLKKALTAHWNTANANDLQTVGTTWKFLRSAAPDPDFMCYVAGSQPATVIDYQVVPGDTWYRPDVQRIEFIASPEGDGTVTWDSGRLPGIPMWYVADTAHDMLCAQPSAFPAYLDILASGRTSRLPSTPPARARGVSRANTFVLPPTPPADSIPGERDLRSMGFSGQPEISAKIDTALPHIAVSVTHGSLSYARHPVMVGHYQGDTVVNAEAVLDRQLGGQLTRNFDLGLYPGAVGSHALFLNDSPNAEPMGAVIVGLGKIGELRPSLLESSVRGGLLDFALRAAQWPDQRFGEAGRPRSAAISCLLVGTGDGGVPLGDSVKAILNAAVDANAALIAKQLNDRVLIDRLEFIELYEDVAIGATNALREALRDKRLREVIDWPKGCLENGEAGHRRIRFDPACEWYQRVQIKGENEGNVLRFVFPTDRARAEETTATGQLALADDFVRVASSNTRQNPEAAKTLFEMLLPLRLREMAPQQGNMVVLVDKKSACYPWELLENRWGNDSKPPSVNAGFIRQFITQEFRPLPLQTGERTALVIGDPDLGGNPDFDQLPGAQAEAEQVVQVLGDRGYVVTDCISQSPIPILENLHRQGWKILHLAGHGVHEFREGSDKPLSGMVIGYRPGEGNDKKGRAVLLTPGDIHQMRFVPDLVFINCCHLGQMRNAQSLDRLGLAANLGEEFIRMGVRAVIAAGWAVDDQAGAAFAATFYNAMLDGKAFGEAVRLARADIHQRFEGCNTWGAYQCYGDPDFRFTRRDERDASALPDFASPRELITELDNLAADLRAGWEGPAADTLQALEKRIPDGQQSAWYEQGDLRAALGLAWGEARIWDTATTHLKAALEQEKGEFTLRVLEQYANFRVRQAAEQWQSTPKEGPTREARRQKLVELTEGAIFDLDTVCRCFKTAERLSLLGGAYKRLATIQEDDAQRTNALVNMANHYRLAYNPKKPKAYPFTNWVAGHLLAMQLDPIAAGFDAAPPMQDLEKLIAGLTSSRDQVPNFWDSASLADLRLTRLLWQTQTPARRRSGTTTAGEVIDTYRQAIARGASPREKSSVAEHIRFLLDLWPAEDKATQDVLKEILESLS